jgi:hypothetical protein
MPFEKGNEIGKETRFKEGNNAHNKYKKEYCQGMVEYFRNNEMYPLFELYADSINVTDETLRNWCENYPEFGSAYNICKNIQKGRLIDGALSGRLNPTFSQFVAKNCHGMRDKTESDSTVKFTVTLPPDIDEECN